MKAIRPLSICVAICALPFVLVDVPTSAIETVQSLKKPKPKIVIPIQPPQDYIKKFTNVALAPTCPRTIDVSESLSSSSETASEHEHCPSCKMGVFFRRDSETMSCSYCEIEKQG